MKICYAKHGVEGIENCLFYLSASDPDSIESDEFEMIGEDEEGREGSADISITNLAEEACKALTAQRKRIAELEADVEQHRVAEEMQIDLRKKADEREAALWETLIKIADCLGIDCQAARGKDGKPSDVYINHIKRAKTLAQADELANCCDFLTDQGHIDAAIEVHSLSQELRQQAEQC